MAEEKQRIFLIRHGETEWSRSGRHTSTTDLSLTSKGREDALRLRGYLSQLGRMHVFTSPMARARQTCELAVGGLAPVIDADLLEWNYGDYEGLTTAEIWQQAPGWLVFSDGCPGGETPREVGTRADRMIAKVRAVPGDVAMFSHGHLLRVLTARWLDLAPADGRHFLLDTATVNVLGYYHDVAAIQVWNAPVT